MRILIDLQGAQGLSRTRGLGRFSLWFAKALIRNRKEHDIHLLLNGNFPNTISLIQKEFEGILASNNIHIFYPLPHCSYTETTDFERKNSEAIYKYFVNSIYPDFLIIPSFFEGLGDQCIHKINKTDSSFKTIVFVHDLIPYLYPDIYMSYDIVKSFYEEKLHELRESNGFLVYSNSTKNDLHAHANIDLSLIHSVGCAVDESFKPIEFKNYADLKEKFSIQSPFIMYTGGNDHRKNIQGLIKAYSQLSLGLRKKHQLLVVCSLSKIDIDEYKGIARKAGLSHKEIIFTGFVADEELLMLYNLCKLFIFPSLYEGFGLPILEAMSCGKPVICGNNSSLPEVMGYNEALFDSSNIQSITDKMTQALSDNDFYQSLKDHSLNQAKKFSWNKVAVETIKVLENQAEPKKIFFPVLDNNVNFPKLINYLINRSPHMTEQQLKLLSRALNLSFTIDL